MGISVVIPAYNAGALIEEALESVLTQDFPADEIIVVNDGSTDRDYSALETRHHSIRVINQSNRGVSAARNVGCDAATQDLIAILDADDVWLPGKLLAQKRYLDHHPEVAAVFCRGRSWHSKPGIAPSHDSNHPVDAPWSSVPIRLLTYADFACSFCVHPSTMMVKRTAWRIIGGYNENLRYGEDWDFYLRLSHGHRTALIAKIAMLYRQHPDSVTAHTQKSNHWAEVISHALNTLGTRDEFGNEVDPQKLQEHLFDLHFMHGYEHFWSGSHQIALREFSRARTLHPTDPKTIAYWTLALVPGARALLRRIRQPPPGPHN